MKENAVLLYSTLYPFLTCLYLFYHSSDFLSHFFFILFFSETHFTNAETCNFFFMTLKSLIYFARSLMRLARNGTWVFYEPARKDSFSSKNASVRTDAIV